MVSTCYTQENTYNTNPNWQDVIDPTVLSYKLVSGGGREGERECVCLHVPVPKYIHRDQRTTCMTRFSSSIV